MKIAVASGEGGTGKTSIATKLAWVIAEMSGQVHYIDCDVEDIKIAMNLPDDRGIAEAYSTGRMIVEVLPGYKKEFAGLYENICERLRKRRDKSKFKEKKAKTAEPVQWVKKAGKVITF